MPCCGCRTEPIKARAKAAAVALRARPAQRAQPWGLAMACTPSCPWHCRPSLHAAMQYRGPSETVGSSRDCAANLSEHGLRRRFDHGRWRRGPGSLLRAQRYARRQALGLAALIQSAVESPLKATAGSLRTGHLGGGRIACQPLSPASSAWLVGRSALQAPSGRSPARVANNR